jgi:mannosyltransferase OCH1-like enzyme
MKIEKIIHQVWIGNLKAPELWMDSWKEKNPKWKYIRWDNENIFSRDWKCQKQIDYYRERSMWHGIADIVRYEILFEFGGIMPGADSKCIEPIDDLFDNDYELFAVSTKGNPKEWRREDRAEMKELPLFLSQFKDKSIISIAPIYAAKKGSEFLEKIIDEMRLKTDLKEPWKTTGNLFGADMIKKYNPRIKIFPMHQFLQYQPRTFGNPDNYVYIGKNKIYASHKWGTTKKCYQDGMKIKN